MAGPPTLQSVLLYLYPRLFNTGHNKSTDDCDSHNPARVSHSFVFFCHVGSVNCLQSLSSLCPPLGAVSSAPLRRGCSALSLHGHLQGQILPLSLSFHSLLQNPLVIDFPPPPYTSLEFFLSPDYFPFPQRSFNGSVSLPSLRTFDCCQIPLMNPLLAASACFNWLPPIQFPSCPLFVSLVASFWAITPHRPFIVCA